MNRASNTLLEHIKRELVKHGTLSLLCYKVGDAWMIKKWGEFDDISSLHGELFTKYRLAGFDEEADSLTLIELPQDAEAIYKVLAGGSLKGELSKLGIELPN